MQNALETFTEGDISPVSLLEMKKRLTPGGYARFLKTKGDVFWWPAGRFFVVTSHHLAKEALKNPALSADRSAFFISRMPNLDLRLIGDFFGVISKMMVMSDNPAHANRRGNASGPFDEKLIEKYRPMVEKSVENLIAKARRTSGGAPYPTEFDFVKEIAEKLPSMVLADLFQIPEEDREHFYRASNNMTQFFGGASRYRNEDGVEVNESAKTLRGFFEKMLEDRKEKRGGDFLSLMLNMQPRFGLTDQEIVSQAIMMLVAGQITTTDQFCNNMFTLLSTPGAADRLRARPELIPTALEELNRLDPGVSYLFRVAKEKTEVGGHAVEPGQTVFISVHAVNRDPEIFAGPDACDLGRQKNPHLADGYGAHYCLGARLARLQMAACFRQLVLGFPNLRLSATKTPVRKHHSLAFSGFESLPLEI
jgi:cytochrome P450